MKHFLFFKYSSWEIHQALFIMEPLKSSGLSGLPPYLFSKKLGTLRALMLSRASNLGSRVDLFSKTCVMSSSVLSQSDNLRKL